MLQSNGPLSLYELRSASRPQSSAIVFAFVLHLLFMSITHLFTCLILSLRLFLDTTPNVGEQSSTGLTFGQQAHSAMVFTTRNLYYLRISRTTVLPFYLYLDQQHVNWMSDVVLQYVLRDLHPL